MARPLKDINWDYVERMMEAGCNAKEISGKYRIDTDTFYTRFKKHFECGFQDYSAKASAGGEGEIRTMQYAKAIIDKNPPMLTFLGRVRLGQREPDAVSAVAPRQDDLNKDHIIMAQEHLIATLKEQLANGNKPQAE